MTPALASRVTEEHAEHQSTPKKTFTAYARGMGGGMLVGMPVFMTMEIWWGGFTLPPTKLLLLIAFNYGILLVLQHFSGLHPRKTRGGQLRAALVAYGLGLVTAALMLLALGVISTQTAGRDFVGKVVLTAVAISVGASIAMSEFGEESHVSEKRKDAATYLGRLGMAAGGAMVFGFGIAPTDEPMIVGMKLPWHHALALVAVSLLQVHLIVYSVGFKSDKSDDRVWWRKLVKEGVGAYAVALFVSSYLLWTFGRVDGETGLVASVYQVVALGFVTSLGAAAGELLL